MMFKEAKQELQNKANEVWESYFGNITEGNDCFGIKIRKVDFKNKNSIYGWDIDYICPKSNFGSTCIENLQPLSLKILKQKKDKLIGSVKIDCENKSTIRQFKICSNPFFSVAKDKKKIGIIEIETNNLIDHFFVDNNKNNLNKVYVYNGYFWIIDVNKNNQSKFWYYAPIDFKADNGVLKQLGNWKQWK